MELYDLQVMFSSLFFSAPHKPQAKHWEACSPILEKRGKIISGEDDGGEGGQRVVRALALTRLLICGRS